MKISQGTRVRELLELVCMSGHITRYAAVLLCGRSIRNTIPRMEHPCRVRDDGRIWESYKLLAVSDKNTVSLARPALALLQDIDYNLAEKYMRMYSTNPFQKDRLLQLSEINAMMMKAHIRIRPDQKPKMSMEFGDLKITRPYFYDSIDVKAIVGMKEAGFTRMRGILYSLSGAYVAYFVNKELVEWKKGDEYKMRHKIDEMTQKNFPALMESKNDIYAVEKALVFGRNPGVMAELLDIQRIRSANAAQNFIGGGTLYNKIYFLPVNDDGIKMLKLLAYPTIYADSLKKLFAGMSEGLFDLAGMRGGEGEFVYPAFTNCISDLIVIRARATQYQNNVYKLYCLPWQIPYLHEFYGMLHNIELKAFEFDI